MSTFRNKTDTIGGPSGSISGNKRTITAASYTAVSNDYTILANAASNAITVNLPAAAGANGRIYNVKKIDSSANAVTLDASGTETIDGALTFVLQNQYDSVSVQSDGTNWYII